MFVKKYGSSSFDTLGTSDSRRYSRTNLHFGVSNDVVGQDQEVDDQEVEDQDYSEWSDQSLWKK